MEKTNNRKKFLNGEFFSYKHDVVKLVPSEDDFCEGYLTEQGVLGGYRGNVKRVGTKYVTVYNYFFGVRVEVKIPFDEMDFDLVEEHGWLKSKKN